MKWYAISKRTEILQMHNVLPANQSAHNLAVARELAVPKPLTDVFNSRLPCQHKLTTSAPHNHQTHLFKTKTSNAQIFILPT